MNRRDFGKLIVGSGVATAVPVQGFAGALGAPVQRSKYIFAVALAHSRTDVSAEMISQMFDVRPGEARGFIGKMVKNGVVDPPNADGIARLAEPLQRIVPQIVEYNPAGGYAVKGPVSAMKDKAVEFAQDVLDSGSNPPENKEFEGPEPKETSPSIDDPERPEASDAARSAE